MPLMWIHASRAYSLVSKETFERERCWKRSWTPVPQLITKHQKSRSDPYHYWLDGGDPWHKQSKGSVAATVVQSLTLHPCASQHPSPPTTEPRSPR